jgi:transposase
MYSSTKLEEEVKSSNQLFIGLDIHKTNWSVCIRTREFEHRTFQQESDPEILHHYLEKNFRNYSVTIAYEAGCFGFWISRKLQEKGYRCLVVHALDIPGSDKESRRKSDHSDCRKIARELSNGTLKGVYLPERSQESFRCMFRQRQTLTNDLRKVKNRIRSLLSLKFEHIPLREALDSLLRRHDFLRKEVLAIELKVRHYVQKYYPQEYSLLLSIPGIGPIVSQAILAEIGDISRFKRIDDLCSFIGLVPNTYQSGDTLIIKGMTNRSHHLLRTYFVESAWTAVRRDPELIAYYKKYSGKMLGKKIIVKVARKLLVRVYYCLKTKQHYKINHNQNRHEVPDSSSSKVTV